MTIFNCKCNNGTFNEFYWEMTNDQYPIPNQSAIEVDQYQVRSLQNPKDGVFTIQVLESDKEIKILHQSRDFVPSLSGKGITAGMLIELFRIYKGKTIISSSRKPTDILGESRSDDMNKVYKRLTEEGIVGYDNIRDIYFYRDETNSKSISAP